MIRSARGARGGLYAPPGARWVRRAACALCLSGLAPPGHAGPLDEPHLAPLARTAEEAARVAAVTAPPNDFSAAQPFEANPGGAATAPARNARDAFSHPSANLPPGDGLSFRMGDALFHRPWVSAPSSTRASDGLGPLFNARACSDCHVNDGRGHPGDGPGSAARGLVLRLSVPAAPDAAMAEIADDIATGPDPVYGHQIQTRALPGLPAEARIEVRHTERAVPLSGGQTTQLRGHAYRLADPGYGPLDRRAMISPRIAPPMIGLGLIEAIPAADILAGADPDDADGNGISGRANIVWSRAHAMAMLGRFGQKAGQATIRDQTAAAFSEDLGLSSPLLPEGHGDCMPAQTTCRGLPDGGDAAQGGVEIVAEALDLTVFYSQHLAVPARQEVEDPDVLRGKRVFHDTGCADCHRPAFVTHRLPGDPARSFQLIWPYSDLLLHDMGAELADNRPEARATGREWRTAPLWGIGRTASVGNGRESYLHDGRARTALEAILWHGGEARAARDRVTMMPPADRAALIRFLESL